MQIKSIIHNSIAMFPLQDLNTGEIRTHESVPEVYAMPIVPRRHPVLPLRSFASVALDYVAQRHRICLRNS
jgi:hypothetical protein